MSNFNLRIERNAARSTRKAEAKKAARAAAATTVKKWIQNLFVRDEKRKARAAAKRAEKEVRRG